MKLIPVITSAFILLFAGCAKHDGDNAESNLLAATKLPPIAVGDFVGMYMFVEGDAVKIGSGMAICTVAEVGERYVLTFKGGTPPLEPGAPSIGNVMFARTSGSQEGVFHSLARDGSVDGIHISTYMTNLNVEVKNGASKIIFTGRK